MYPDSLISHLKHNCWLSKIEDVLSIKEQDWHINFSPDNHPFSVKGIRLSPSFIFWRVDSKEDSSEITTREFPKRKYQIIDPRESSNLLFDLNSRLLITARDLLHQMELGHYSI